MSRRANPPRHRSVSAPQPAPSVQQSLATRLVANTQALRPASLELHNDVFDNLHETLVPRLAGLLVRPPRLAARPAAGPSALRWAPLPSYNVATDGLQSGELNLGTAERPLSVPLAQGFVGSPSSAARRILRKLVDGAARPEALKALRDDPATRLETGRVARFVLGQALCRRAELRAAGSRLHEAYAPLGEMVRHIVASGVDVCDEKLTHTRRGFVGYAVELAALLHDAELFDLLLAHQRTNDAQRLPDEVQTAHIDLAWIALGSPERRAGTSDLRDTIEAWQAQVRADFEGHTPAQKQDWGHIFSLPAVAMRDVALQREVLAWSAVNFRMSPAWNEQLLSLCQDSFVDGLEAFLEVPGVDVNMRRDGDWMGFPEFAAGPSALHVAAEQHDPALWADAERAVDLLLAHGADPGQLAMPSSDAEAMLMPRSASYFALRAGNVTLFARLEQARTSELAARRAGPAQSFRRAALAVTLRATASALRAWNKQPPQTEAVKLAIATATQCMLRDGELAAFSSRRMTMDFFSNALNLIGDERVVVAEVKAQLEMLAASFDGSAALVATRADDGRAWGVLPIIRYIEADASAVEAYELRGAFPVLVTSRDFREAKLLLEHGKDLLEDDVVLAYATALTLASQSRARGEDPASVAACDDMLEAFRARLGAAPRVQRFVSAALEVLDLAEVKKLLARADEQRIAWWTSVSDKSELSNVFGEAIRAGSGFVAALVKALPTGQVAPALEAPDAQGDTPLHLAARQSAGALAPLLNALRLAGAQPHELENEEGRTPALEALAAGNVDAFRSLSASRSARAGRSTPSLLANALSGRAGKLTVPQLDAVASFDDGARLLRQAAPTMLRRFARRGEAGPSKTLLNYLKAVDPQLQAQASLQARLLHAVAEADSTSLFSSLRDVLDRSLMLQLAAATDEQGLLPWQLAVGEALAAQLQALAPTPIEPVPTLKSGGLHVLAEVARLAAGVQGAAAGSEVREARVSAFLTAAGRLQRSNLDASASRKLQGLAWRIVDQLAAAGDGAGMGVHYGAHAPGLSPQVLRERAETHPLKSGSSCFAEQDGLTLLRLRAQALAQAQTTFARPQAASRPRLRLDLAASALGSYGFERRASDGELVQFAQASGIRFILRPGPKGPQFVSIYPVRSVFGA